MTAGDLSTTGCPGQLVPQLLPPSTGPPLSCPRPSYVASEESRILVLTELLERKAHSPFYQEGVSNALLKMAELGLTQAADVLLQNGANLNFEGQGEPRGAGDHRWLKSTPALGGQPGLWALPDCSLRSIFIYYMGDNKETSVGGLPSPCGFQVALTTSGPRASLLLLLPCDGFSRSSQLPNSLLPLK